MLDLAFDGSAPLRSTSMPSALDTYPKFRAFLYHFQVFVDNYLDGGYHVSFLHKDLTSGLDIDSYKTQVGERFSLQKVRGDNQGQQKDRLGGNSVYAFMYPNMMINRYGPWMDTNIVIPKGEQIFKRARNLA